MAVVIAALRRMFQVILLLSAAAGAGAAAPEFRGHGGPVRAIAVAPDGAVLTGAFDTRAILWDGTSGAARQVMRFHEGSVTAVAFLPDGAMATAGQDGRIALWRGDAQEPEAVVAAHEGPVTALAVSPSGKALASSGWDRRARVMNLAGDGTVLLEGHEDNVNGVAFLPGGGIATAGYDGTLRLWDDDGSPRRVVAVGAPLNALAVGPEATVWAAGADGVLRAFDATGEAVGEVAAGKAALVSVAAGTGIVVAGGIDGTAILIDPRLRQVLRIIEVSEGTPVWSVALDHEGEVLFAGGADNVVRPWNVATGEPLGGSSDVVATEEWDGSMGARVFRRCAACHTLGPDDGNRAGPTLHGIFGRRIATAEDYHYSEALRQMDIVWTPETVSRLFEIGPAAMTPGSAMPEQRISDPGERAALIEFLEEHTR